MRNGLTAITKRTLLSFFLMGMVFSYTGISVCYGTSNEYAVNLAPGQRLDISYSKHAQHYTNHLKVDVAGNIETDPSSGKSYTGAAGSGTYIVIYDYVDNTGAEAQLQWPVNPSGSNPETTRRSSMR